MPPTSQRNINAAKITTARDCVGGALSMTPPNPKREQTLEPLTGPVFQVTLTASTGREKIWTLPKVLLCHHASYFQRIRYFKEDKLAKVALESFDPEIFKLFVEFIYFGRYMYRNDLSDYNRVRDSARAWVLGDYLDVIKFKEMAINNLYNIYFPDPGRPRSGIGPDAVDYYCTMGTLDSPLYNFCQEVLVAYWSDADVIVYNADHRAQWDEIWRNNLVLMSDVLFLTKTQHNGVEEDVKNFELPDGRAVDKQDPWYTETQIKWSTLQGSSWECTGAPAGEATW